MVQSGLIMVGLCTAKCIGFRLGVLPGPDGIDLSKALEAQGALALDRAELHHERNAQPREFLSL